MAVPFLAYSWGCLAGSPVFLPMLTRIGDGLIGARFILCPNGQSLWLGQGVCPLDQVFFPTVIHALACTIVHEKVLSFLSGEGNARDRFDASAPSLSNSMIRMPHKHHCLSLTGIGEARMREFDPCLASRCPYPQRVSWLVCS